MFEEITKCRICGNENLVSVLNLGNQFLTGVFPATRDEEITRGPLELIKCYSDASGNKKSASQINCGLVQLRQSYDSQEMYGRSYGYRSSLNQTMVSHLRVKAEHLQRVASLQSGDVVLDIGSNDGTLLSCFPDSENTLIGIDPTAEHFKEFYPRHAHRLADCFSLEKYQDIAGRRKAKIVTSIAMVYDLEQPFEFVRQVSEILAADGYDTICHEHREYYTLTQILWMIERTDLKVIDVELNDVNGGSFAVTVAKGNSSYRENRSAIDSLVRAEREGGAFEILKNFRSAVLLHRTNMITLLDRLKSEEASVLGYGASTKGNVILQFCGITTEHVPAIAEVNPDKFGKFTPGTLIPIISEAEAHRLQPDYFLAFPWHFRENLLQREASFLNAGGRMIFPLPQIEIVVE
jgi:2-polyprenyl-3-methyl-5-hydroxy-6-metoxy-1,4-benzoquinol methylase